MNSTELYAACRSADRLTQAAAYETLWGYVYRVAFYMVRDQPEADALAQDCAQVALVRVYERLEECREPAAFRVWARRIVSHIVIDELRRRKRLVPLAKDEWRAKSNDIPPPANSQPSLEATVFEKASQAELRNLIMRAPISDRSRRVVVGRYLDNTADDVLAQAESKLIGRLVLPSHVQVTRAKNLAKLRDWDPLRAFFEITD